MKARVLTISLVTSWVAACGGGGGGGSSPPPQGNPPPPTTYTVNGTVTGLTGTLVLRVNDASDVSVATNGTVTLASAQANGASYSVTVKTQPSNPTQKCDLANASGTIAAANVTNITVTCAAVPLTLASSTPSNGATGVTRDAPLTLTFSTALDASAATVRLADTGGDVTATTQVTGAQLVVTPAAKLARLGAYTLTVSGMKGAGGELLAAPVTLTFTAADGTWSAPALLETDPGDINVARVAMAPNGDALAVWTQVNGSHTDLVSNHYTPAGWQGTVLVETYDVEDVRDPDVRFDANGNALAVWTQGSGGSYKVWTNRFYGTSTWAAPFRVEIASGVAQWPVLDIDPNGDATVAWTKLVDFGGGMGPQYVLGAAHLSLASGWSTTPGLSTGADALLPALCSDVTGRVLAVWYQAGLGFADIWTNSYLPGTGWLTPAAVEQSMTGGADTPQIVCQPDGNALAVWRRFEAGVGHLHAAQFNNGGWTASLTLDGVDSTVSTPTLAGDAQGNAVVIWTQTDRGLTRLWSRRFVVGHGWSAAVTIDDATSSDAGWQHFAMNAGGDGVAVWATAGAGEHLRTWAARLTDGKFGPAQAIDPDRNSNAYDPRVALDPAGNTIAVWRKCTSTCDLRASRFE